MASLAEIRAKLAAQSNNGSQGGSQDNTVYAHWNISEGQTARIRFLPDADSSNTFFWVERQIIRLPFSGVKGDPTSKPVVVQVPCMEMYGKEVACPILSEVRTWFKDPALEEMGKKYWKKKSYLFQGFVRDNPLSSDKAPENPIRRFIISPQIFTLIKAALMDPELENLPIDYDAGLDFYITKTSKGNYADYNTSKWARKESALSEAERQAIDTHGLFNLKDFLPKKPTDVELKIIKEMFEASVDGHDYDEARWGQYFKPSGMATSTAVSKAADEDDFAPPVVKTSVVKTVAVSKPAVDDSDEDEVPFEVKSPAPAPAPKASNQRAEDIIAMIRNRQKA